MGRRPAGPAVQRRLRRPDRLAAAGRAGPARRRAGLDAGGRPRTDRTRAALVLWGGWLLVTGVVFSFGQGIIHAYYTVALAPAIGALVGIGAAVPCGCSAAHLWARIAAAGIVGGIGVRGRPCCSERSERFLPWLDPGRSSGRALAVAAVC